VFDHSRPDYPEAVLRATGGKGVDLIIEMLANQNLPKDLAMLAKSGRVIVVGSRGPVEFNPRDIMVRDADIRGLVVFNCPAHELAGCHAAIDAGLRTGTLAPVIGMKFGLGEASAAHRVLMEAGHRGKTVLRCAEPG
jgi:NADPH:quinone reductase